MVTCPPIITIDLEDWFHLLECEAVPDVSGWATMESRIEGSTERLLSVLANRGVTATFFSLGWVAERYPTLLRRIAAAGHELGCHSHTHSLVYTQSPAMFREETLRALGTISDVIAAPVHMYRAPGFSLTRESTWAFEILADLNVKIDCSVFPGGHAHGGTGSLFPAVPFRIDVAGQVIHEFPASVASIGPFRLPFSGGGYFRLLPLPLIWRLAARSPHVMMYFHPRDVDEGQPRLLGLGLARRFRAYVGIPSALRKLDHLLARLGGQSVGAADREFAWDTSPMVRLAPDQASASTRP